MDEVPWVDKERVSVGGERGEGKRERDNLLEWRGITTRRRRRVDILAAASTCKKIAEPVKIHLIQLVLWKEEEEEEEGLIRCVTIDEHGGGSTKGREEVRRKEGQNNRKNGR